MIEILSFKLFETNLVLSELDKEIKGEKSGDIFLRKIEKGDSLRTITGETVTITKIKINNEWLDPSSAFEYLRTNGKFDSLKAKRYFKTRFYDEVFLDTKGKLFKLKDFEKTEEFGSKGAGRKTLSFESIQAIFLAIKQSNPSQDINSGNFIKLFENYLNEGNFELVKIPEKVKITEESLADYENDKNWVYTFCYVTNKIWKSEFIDKSKIYTIYHESYKSGALGELKTKWSEISKVSKFSEISFSKWCPADVFLIEKKFEERVSNLIKEIYNIEDLNKFFDRIFQSKILIPISLKKVTKPDPESSSKTFSIIVNRERGKELPDFQLKEFLIGEPLKGIGTKIETDAVWFTSDKKFNTKIKRVMNFDSSNTSLKTNIDGEVEGSASRGHGKVSLNVIQHFIDSNCDERGINKEGLKIPKSEELRQKTLEELKSICIEKFDEIKIEPKLRGLEISNNLGKLISKVQSLYVTSILKSIHSVDSDLCNKIITDMFRYALSIKTHKFDTPMYLRVI